MNKMQIIKMRLLRFRLAMTDTIWLAIASIILAVAVSVDAAFEVKPGVVPLGMGKAYVSMAEGSNAIFWNPAGLGNIKNAEISMLYGKEYVGLDSDNLSNWYAGVVYPLGEIGSIGIGDLYFNSEIYKENTSIISYGKRIGDISGGINFKLLSVMYSETGYTKTDPIFMANGMSKTRISIDAGVIYKATDEISIGVNIEDVNQPNMSLGNETEGIVPIKIGIGSSYKLGKWTPAIGVSYRNKKLNNKRDINIQAGVEFWSASEDIGLRGGYNTNEFTAGASFRFLSGGQIDYAFIYSFNAIKGILGSHSFGLTWKI